MKELQLIEFPGYFDIYSEQIREALDLDKGLLRLYHATVHGIVVATRNLIVRITSNGQYEILGIVVKTTRFRTLADFQQSYPEDSIEILREAMIHLDCINC
jgi:hypothetical protein